MIGHVYFNKVKPVEFRNWELGYVFNPLYYGNGYATEACKCILQFGFDQLDIHRVSAKCSPENIRSWKLLERLSMRREGYSLKSVIFKYTSDGQPIWWDEYQYAILAEEGYEFEYKYIE
jgi:RimJ/RimL family protein N-acetyltransferase